MNYSKALLISIIIIAAVTAINHFFLSENRNHTIYDGHGLSFLCMIVVGGVGYMAWRKYPVKWPSRLWVLIYAVAFCTLGAVRITDKFIFHLPTSFIVFVQNIRDFFDSPMPFLILYVLASYIIKPTTVQKEAQP